MPSIGRASEDCLKCKTFFTAVIKALGENATATDLLNAMLDECAAITAPGSDERLACDEFAHWAVHELPAVETTFESYEPVGLCSILGICLVECCSGYKTGAPSQVMLAPRQDASQMTVTWVAAYPGGAQAARPAARYWPAGSPAATQSVNASMRTYTKGGWQGWIMEAVLSGLQPGAQYQYQVGDAALSTWGPAPTPTFSTWNVGRPGAYAMVADIGLANSQGTVAGLLQLAQSGSIDFLAAYGDLSYADAYQAVWDQQGRRLQPITSVVPYLVCPGNHEIPWEFVALRHRFSMPGAGWLNNTAKWYSLDWSYAHLVFLDSELEEDLPHFSDEQLAWLQQDLAAAQQRRDAYPWIIVGFHRPLYCSNGDDKNCVDFVQYMRHRIEDILYANKVDLVVYGHVHSYERLYPTYKNKPVQFNYSSPAAPTYILNGAAGNPEGNSGRFTPLPPPNNWAAAHSGEFGYGLIQLPDPSTLNWQFFAGPNTGPAVLIDSCTITK